MSEPDLSSLAALDFTPTSGPHTAGPHVEWFPPPTGYKRSNSIVNVATALAKAQAKFKSALKDASNEFYRSKYADYESCLAAVQEALGEFGLALLHFPVQEQRENVLWAGVTTLLAHGESGEYFEGTLLMPCVKQKQGSGWVDSVDPHTIGSAVTYAARYSLMNMLRLGRDDDDGNAAQTGATVNKTAAAIAQRHAPNPTEVQTAGSVGVSDGGAPVVATDLSGPAPDSGSIVTHPGMVEAKNMGELVGIYNKLPAVDKKLYKDHFDLRRSEFTPQ